MCGKGGVGVGGGKGEKDVIPVGVQGYVKLGLENRRKQKK